MRQSPRVVCDRFSLVILAAMCLRGHPSHTVSLLIAAALHEGGHLLAARLCRIPLASLRISILGARLELCDPLLPYRDEWLLCAAGPLSSLLAAAAAGALARCGAGGEVLRDFAMISLTLGAVNLLPIGWLDGGRMFRVTCMQLLPPRVAEAVLWLVSFAFFLLLWMTSVYLLLRVGNTLTLFAFSFSLFVRFFMRDR